MQNKVLSSILILAIVGVAVFFIQKNHKTNSPIEISEQDQIPQVSPDIIWNAFTVNGTAFIYPADWLFVEAKEGEQVVGFRVTNPVSSNSNDYIDVGGNCPSDLVTGEAEKNKNEKTNENAQFDNSNSACINNIWLRASSQSGIVLKVFSDMQKFSFSTASGAEKSQ